QEIEKKVFIPALEKSSSRYFYIPFDVPKGVESLIVTYDYDKKNGANVLDLGIFDTGFDQSETSLRGFRGWSGGRRNRIFISKNAATNGYLQGRIPAGKWRVILGLYKIAPEGVEVKITVKFNENDAQLFSQPKEESSKTWTLSNPEKSVSPD